MQKVQFIVRYTGQTGRQLISRFTEHQRYIQNNKTGSVFVMHIFHNRH